MIEAVHAARTWLEERAEQKPTTGHLWAVPAGGITVNCDPGGTVKVYVNESRFTWKVEQPGRGYEVIVFTPVKRRTRPLDEM